jgi:hypothetical protein
MLSRDFSGLFDTADVLRPIKFQFYARQAHIIILRPLALALSILISPIITVSYFTLRLLFNRFIGGKSSANLRKQISLIDTVFAPYAVFMAYAATSGWLKGKDVSPGLSAFDVIFPYSLMWKSSNYAISTIIVAVTLVFAGEFAYVWNYTKLFSYARNSIRPPSYYIQFLSKDRILETGQELLIGLIGVGGFAVIGGSIYGLFLLEQYVKHHYAPWLDRAIIGVVVVAAALGGAGLLVLLVMDLYRLMRARMRTRAQIAEAGVAQMRTRHEIADALSRFADDAGRSQFVALLGLRSRQEGWKPTGAWPDARLPVYRGMGSELARLEEQWLGLDR